MTVGSGKNITLFDGHPAPGTIRVSGNGKPLFPGFFS
jgi:hypothetical protein